MRAARLAGLLGALFLVPGCSSSSSSPATSAPDAAGTSDAASNPVDAQADSAVVLPPTGSLCTQNADCDGGVCGYYAAAGCGAPGVCVAPADAGPVTPACGCDGQPDPYLANGFTAAPASSAGACIHAGDASADDAGGEDATAGNDAGDAGSPGIADAASE